MSSSSRNFDSLRRLMTLKRHEVPPPGYFNGFSAQIISRIEAGELGEPESIIGRWLENVSWLQRLRSMLEAQPMFAGAFGAVACALLISGILFTENGGQASLGITPVVAGESSLPFSGSSTLSASDNSSSPLVANNSLEGVQLVSSTNPVAPATASLFDQIQLPAVRASYTLPGGN
jgi:hypothetical protein